MRTRICMELVAVVVALALTAALAADTAKRGGAKAGGQVTVGGILTTDGNVDSLMALTDGEETPAKYVFGERFDKKTLKGIFSVSRVQLVYVENGDTRQLLNIRKEPAPAKGTVTGTVMFGTDFWVAVKPVKGPPDGYALNWPPGEIGAKLKTLLKGDTVRIRFHTDFERHRIDALDVVRRKANVEDAGRHVDKDIEADKPGR